MDRREFLAKAGLLATWAAIPVILTECGSSDKNPSQPTGNGDIDGAVSTSSGHSHSVTITKAELQAGNSVTLTLTGSGHTHSVSLSAQEVMSIGDGQKVSKQSTTNSGHSHLVTFN